MFTEGEKIRRGFEFFYKLVDHENHNQDLPDVEKIVGPLEDIKECEIKHQLDRIKKRVCDLENIPTEAVQMIMELRSVILTEKIMVDEILQTWTKMESPYL